MGKEVEEFELRFAKYFGARHAVMTNSGSSANLLMISALFFSSDHKHSLKRGDEIIVPAVAWSTTYFPLQQYGLRLKFVDIDKYTLNYDIDALKNAVNNETRAIMVVNLLGNPNDFEKLQDIISDKNILMLEDNCESMGATFLAKQAGTYGLMGTFSSFFSHHISTMEGGMVLTDDQELYHILLAMRAHGWTRDLPKYNAITGEKSDDPFEESWRFVLPGYNLRPTELSGAVGCAQLIKLPNLIEERRKNGALLQSTLSDHSDLIIQSEIGNSSWFGFSLVIRPGSKLKRSELANKLQNIGFEIRPIVSGNFTKNPVMRYFDYVIAGSIKNAEYIDQHGIFIGNQAYPMTEAITALSKLSKD